MRKLIIRTIFGLMVIPMNLIAGTHYEMRVDGLACPYCAFGIEKKLKAIEGTKNIDVDLDKGLVKVDLPDGKKLNEQQMVKLFNDSGFTFRTMTETITNTSK